MSTIVRVERGHRRQRLGAALLGLIAVFSVLVPNLGAPSAGAEVGVASNASLTWKVSTNAWTSGSLSPAHATTPPATKDPEAGFVFSAGGGTYDTDTGAASIHFGGSLTLGNTNQGNYRITIANPHLVLGADGTGHVDASVTWLCNISFGECAAGQTQTTDDVVVATLSGVETELDEGRVELTVTPDYPLQADQTGPNAGRRQFPQPFLDALLSGLRGHFRDTVTPIPDPNPKAPAPITFAFDVALPTTTSTSTSTTAAPTSTTAPASTTSTTASASTTSTTTAPATSTSTTAPTVTTSTTAPATTAIQGGTLDWGVKASFRSYITGSIAKGSVTPGDGAATNADGTFRFPSGTGSYVSGDDADLGFGGSVRFVGHDGALDMLVRDPRVAIDGDDGVLTVDVISKSLSTGQTTTYDDLAFADLDLAGITPTTSGTSVVIPGIKAALSDAGAPAFAGFYTAGAALDPLTLRLTLAAPGSGSTTSTVAGSSTSSSSPIPPGVGCLDKTSVAAGGTLQVCGSGFLAGEQVQVFLHSTPLLVTVLTADGAGTARSTITIPATAPTGTHKVELRGVTSGRSLMSADVTVTAAGSSTLPRTGTAVFELFRIAVIALGLGLLLSGRTMAGSAAG